VSGAPGYVPMDWELGPDQTKYTRNIAPPGAPPYYVAASNPTVAQLQVDAFQEAARKTTVAHEPPLKLQVASMEIGGDPFGNDPVWFGGQQYDPATGMLLTSGAASGGGAATQLGNAGCDLITDAGWRALCKAGVGIFTGGGGGDPTGGKGGGLVGPTGSGSCAAGYVWSDTLQRCMATNPTAYIPGGTSATYGNAVVGAFGRAALQPAQVTQTRLMCPAGTVLGKDNLCYNRGQIPKSARKWNPGTKPLMTGGDMNVMRRAKTLEKRIRKLSTKWAPRAKKCAPKKGRK